MTSKLLNLVIYTILVASSCLAQDAKITNISPDQVKDIGENVILNCTAAVPKGVNVNWSKNDIGITLSHIMVAQSDRIQIEHDNVTNTYSLHINNITINDSGTYKCEFQLNMDVVKVIAPVKLDVRKAPSITKHSENLKIDVGQQAELSCTADGYPNPDITWKRENDELLPTGGLTFNGSIYKIQNASKEDRGNYICSASNGVGKTVTVPVLVEIEFAPTMSAKRPKIAQAIGYEVELICSVEAYPPPGITWVKDNKQLESVDDYVIKTVGHANQITVSTLKLSKVEKHHFGDYTCKANNKVGTSETRIEFYGKDVPDKIVSETQKSGSSQIPTINKAVIMIIAMTFSTKFY